MNINLINDFNQTTSHHSNNVETGVLADNNDCFQKLLQLSEHQAEQEKKPVNAKIKMTGNNHEESNPDADMSMTAIYPFNIQDSEQEQRLFINTEQNRDSSEKLNAHLLSDSVISEQATQLLTSIYDSEDLINKVTQQTDITSLSNDNKGVKINFAHKKATGIKGDVNNHRINQAKNTQNANDIMQKFATAQTQFIASHCDKDAAVHTNQELSLMPHANGLSSLLSPSNATATSATINLSTPMNIMQWQSSLTEQIIMFNRQGIQTADIKLHPQELGSLHIKLAMNDDKMHLNMMAAHSIVKGMLESALPFLKTSLEDQGIMLEQANIGDFSMMNDSQQSAMHQSTKRSLPTVQTLDATDVHVEQMIVENNSQKSGLSIFA
ncbi:flagellar hook-length control protein FliK [Gilliamella mensalis]|uniref:flagellar hook-length control protein FliK n=1 Tax=Gilliamella mensalis TaxID=1908520 RepID=UPI000A168690|nr:flagellar hook-length control protein FliK [Gilliamella mensalis]